MRNIKGSSFAGLLSFLSLLFTADSDAETLYEWGMDYESGVGYARTIFSTVSDWEYADAEIAYLRDGTKSIMFRLVPSEPHEKCSRSYSKDTTWVKFLINNQAVHGGVRCGKFVASGRLYYGFWASSDAGVDFVINAFKRSKTVSVKHPLHKFELSAMGFIKLWNNTGGDAL